MLVSLLGGLLLLTGVVRGQAPVAVTPKPTVPVPANARWVAPPTPQPLRPVASANPLVPVRYQQLGDSQTDDSQSIYQIQLEPPGLERISRLDSDAKLQERIRQETAERDPKERVQFPEEPILSRDSYMGRGPIWPARQMIVEPSYVAYKPLYFQDINAERYGWDLGIVHPVLGAAKFYYDLALLPMHCATWKHQVDTSAGYCLPGDPVPFMLYPPEITFEGTVTEIAVIAALVAIFP